jgi:S-adenosylmethionine:diacylglycerol 3-amino-3-carboxypropyl transferase
VSKLFSNILLPWVDYKNINLYTRIDLDNNLYALIYFVGTYRHIVRNFDGLDVNDTMAFRTVNEAKTFADQELTKIGWRLLDENDKLLVLL